MRFVVMNVSAKSFMQVLLEEIWIIMFSVAGYLKVLTW